MQIHLILIHNAAVATLNITAVFADIYELLTNSQDCWPADTLGGVQLWGLFIRLEGHCAGTYRILMVQVDAGGRQRFDPEASGMIIQIWTSRALLVQLK